MEKKKNSLMMGMLVMFISAIMPAMAQTSAPLPSLVGVQPMKMEGATLLRGRMEQESGIKNLSLKTMSHTQPMAMPKATLGSAFRGCVINDGG